MGKATQEVSGLQQVPIIDITGTRKKKKRRYSRGLPFLAGAIERRIGDGLADGFSDYQQRSNKSAKRQRNGALQDIVRNTARSQERVLREFIKIPRDLAKPRLWF